MRSATALLSVLLATLGCRDDGVIPSEPEPTPLGAAVLATATLKFSQLSAGEAFACGVTTASQAYCWGNNWDGQLGDGTAGQPDRNEENYRTKPHRVEGELQVKQVQAGSGHTCAVTTDNRAFCWGLNSSGQLGNGGVGLRHTVPVRVVGAHRFRQLSAGGDHTCGVTTDDRMYCWGANSRGQLGDGTTTARAAPVAVLGDLYFKQVSAGEHHTCAITTANHAYCWGDNAYGQLGDSTGIGRLKPTPVRSTRRFRVISAGSLHTCATTTTDHAFCWGRNEFGTLGDGTTSDRRWPKAVAGGLSFDRVTSGSFHSCAETTGNRAYCWGNGGTVGDGSYRLRLKPVPVAGGLFFKQVDAGSSFTCGVTPEALAFCWGDASLGALGNGEDGGKRLTPTPVAGPT